MLLIICDAFIPTMVSKIIAKRTGKKASVKKLSKEQLKEMQPLADAAAKKMFANVSEVPAFFIAYGCIMLSNQIEE
jgi:maleate cis-trans isomerase